MNAYRSELMRTLDERGYIKDCTEPTVLDRVASTDWLAGYVGFDCTAPSLHVGHLISIMMLRKLQQAGHRPIVLIGGGTTKIGDPSGKDEARKLLSDTEIAANIVGIESVFSKFLTFGNQRPDAILVNNAAWLDELRYIDFLRDYGRCFSVNRMLTQDSVRLRLERDQPLSFLEFNYMILQAYDFVELNRRFGCRLQMGGSDQWGNILGGIELARRTTRAELFGLTSPLLTTASGAKMGKTAAGAIWLNSDLCTPYDYFQFWRNTEDPDVGRFLKLFTEIPLDEIDRLERLQGAELNEAKKRLAWAATALLHGTTAADQAAETARMTFEQGALSENLPVYVVSVRRLQKGIGIQDLGVEAGLAGSNSEIRRAVANNAIALNDIRITDADRTISMSDFQQGRWLKYSVGKKRHVVVKPSYNLFVSYHVLPRGKEWVVKTAGPDDNLYLIFKNQHDAWKRAKELASQPGTQAVLHSKDGKIREHVTVGADAE
jgi:tyrosyl-tRNA synthetase